MSSIRGRPWPCWKWAQNVEALSILFDQPHSVNVVALTPRFAGGVAVGFPVEIGIAWFDGVAEPPGASTRGIPSATFPPSTPLG